MRLPKNFVIGIFLRKQFIFRILIQRGIALKKFLAIFLIAVVVSGLVFVGSLHFGVAQSAQTVNGIITQDTTWTKANSPYILTGPVAVNLGVTLTVEAGVAVALRDYYIQVNGTLVAAGTSSDMIQFSSGQINFTPISNGWAEQTDSGSQFKYVNFNSTTIQSNVPLKFSYCQANSPITVGENSEVSDSTISNTITISGSCNILRNTITAVGNSALVISGGSSQISNNKITGGGTIYLPLSRGPTIIDAVKVNQGAATITNNNINGQITVAGSSLVTNNVVDGTIVASDGAPTISKNTITGGITVNSNQAPIVSQNSVTGFIMVNDGLAQILGNSVIGNGLNFGIGASTDYREGNALFSDNYVANCAYGAAFWGSGGSAVFQRNQIINSAYGITVTGGAVSITGNTLQNNTFGVYLQNTISISALNNNNIVGNQQANLFLDNYTIAVNATYNWWGTTDQSAISNSIHDFNNDFNLGKVNFVPFLTSPNPQAVPNSNAPIPTPNPSPTSNPTSNQSPTASPSQNPTPTQSDANNETKQGLDWTQAALFTVLTVIAVSLVVIAVLLYKRNKLQSATLSTQKS